MERLLLFIKHNFSLLWKIIDWINGTIYLLVFKTKQEVVLESVLSESTEDRHIYRKLKEEDIQKVITIIDNQHADDLVYFQPHGFDYNSIITQYRNPSFLMMGVFDGDNLIGYFFLRFFANKKCFVGRLIDFNYRGKGIGAEMNRIMYQTAWKMGFRCLSTISQNNKAIMHSHSTNQNLVVLKTLKNGYLLVEFVEKN